MIRLIISLLTLLVASAVPLWAQDVLPPIKRDKLSFISKVTCGIDAFLEKYPEADGRGVIIVILDTGVDMGIEGLKRTSLGTPKVIDVQDFSGSGNVPLTVGKLDTLRGRVCLQDTVNKVTLLGIDALPQPIDCTYFVGVFKEARLQNGEVPDVDGDGKSETVFGIVAMRTKDGALAFVDANADGNLSDEKPLRTYRECFDTFTFVQKDTTKLPVMTCALNIFLDKRLIVIHFDDGAHGSHVAGIAAGYNIYATPTQPGYNGIAPGAELVSLKISDGAIGQLTTTGSMKRAYEYAAALAGSQPKPVVVSMSFGVASEIEANADMERYLDSLLEVTPNLYVVVSNGNEGPGISSTGLPAAASRVISVGALLNRDIARDAYNSEQKEHSIWNFSSRGAETPKPDLVAPGSAYSTVPNHSQMPLMSGTSMAAPHVAGAIALLLSALLKEDPEGVRAGLYSQRVMKQALRASARPLAASLAYSELDYGAGLLDVPRALEALRAYRKSGFSARLVDYRVRVASSVHGTDYGTPAAYHRSTVIPEAEVFQVTPIFPPKVPLHEQERFFRVVSLRSTASWLRPVQRNVILRGKEGASIRVLYDRSKLKKPGVYHGKVIATASQNSKFPEVEFELHNTMVVPYLFDHQGWLTLERETLRPGEIRRYFFAVPSDASALTVSIVRQGKQPCEVSGALVTPRGAVAMPISAPADDEQESNVSLTRELEAGIYEVVLQAESGARQPSCFTFEVAIERVSINPTVVTPALLRAKVVNTNSETVRGSLSARISSYVKTHFDTLYAGQIYRLPILLSEKDVALTVKLMLTKEDYNKNTDIGLLILDSLGRKLVAQPVDAATKSIRFVNVYDNPAQVFFEVHYGFADDSPRNFVRLCIEEIHAIQPVTLSSQMNLSVELLPFVPVMLEWQIPNDLPQIPRGYTYRGDLRFEDLFNQLKSIQSFLVPRY
ncbi:MAG: S8 family serine peptidase [Chloroherpetonaceae bacterium]|nr:S8 family serine peptidase [Chloroherpetonaceae bacterium]